MRQDLHTGLVDSRVGHDAAGAVRPAAESRSLVRDSSDPAAVETVRGKSVPCLEVTRATFELPDIRAQPQHGSVPPQDVVEERVRHRLVEGRADIDDRVVACELTTLITGDRLRGPAAEVTDEIPRHRGVQLAKPTPFAGPVVEDQRPPVGDRLLRLSRRDRNRSGRWGRGGKSERRQLFRPAAQEERWHSDGEGDRAR